MIAIDQTLLSEELFTEYFCCPLETCQGCCCVEGDAGAPLEEGEVSILEAIREAIDPYLTDAGRQQLARDGVSTRAVDGSLVTPIIEGRDCAYLCYDAKGCALCAIEQAYRNGKISFQKPISCHLYPIRLTELCEGEALNYDRWPICDSAREKGRELGLPVFRFLKDPLIRRYGSGWYEQAEEVYQVFFAKSKKKC